MKITDDKKRITGAKRGKRVQLEVIAHIEIEEVTRR